MTQQTVEVKVGKRSCCGIDYGDCECPFLQVLYGGELETCYSEAFIEDGLCPFDDGGTVLLKGKKK